MQRSRSYNIGVIKVEKTLVRTFSTYTGFFSFLAVHFPCPMAKKRKRPRENVKSVYTQII